MLARNLIAAAGNAGGELSYWVARVSPGSVTAQTRPRAMVNETNQTIVGRMWNSGYSWFFRLDYDGGADAASYTTDMSEQPAGGQGTLVAVGSSDYTLNQYTYSTTRAYDISNLSTTTIQARQFSNSTITGFANYPPTKQMAVFDGSQTDDRIVMTESGYYEVPDESLYQPRMVVWTFNVTDNVVDSTLTRALTDNAPGYGVRYSQVASGSSGKFAISYTEPGENKTGFATYNNGATPSFSNFKHAPSTANMKNFALRIDENDKLCAVTCVSNQHWFWRGTTAGTYTPNVYYSFNAYSAIGNVISASIDSTGNMYVLGYQSAISQAYRLLKFNTSNTVEWVLDLANSTSNPATSSEGADINVQSIDGQDFLLISLVYQPENTNQYPVYVIKAPLDFDDYTGTYGNIVVSSVSFSPTITTNVASISDAGSDLSGAMGKSNPTASTTGVSLSTSVTDI